MHFGFHPIAHSIISLSHARLRNIRNKHYYYYCCYFSEECDQLKLLFTRLKYPDKLVNFTLSLLPRHRINLFPHWLSAIEQTPFVLSYRLNIRPQLILYVSKSKILWNVFYSGTETCSQCAVGLNSCKDFELGFYFYFEFGF